VSADYDLIALRSNFLSIDLHYS